MINTVHIFAARRRSPRKHTKTDKCKTLETDDLVGEGCKHEPEKNILVSEDKSMTFKAYPAFLVPYINKVLFYDLL